MYICHQAVDINVVLCMLASKSEYQTDTAHPLVLSVLALSPLSL